MHDDYNSHYPMIARRLERQRLLSVLSCGVGSQVVCVGCRRVYSLRLGVGGIVRLAGLPGGFRPCCPFYLRFRHPSCFLRLLSQRHQRVRLLPRQISRLVHLFGRLPRPDSPPGPCLRSTEQPIRRPWTVPYGGETLLDQYSCRPVQTKLSLQTRPRFRHIAPRRIDLQVRLHLQPALTLHAPPEHILDLPVCLEALLLQTRLRLGHIRPVGIGAWTCRALSHSTLRQNKSSISWAVWPGARTGTSRSRGMMMSHCIQSRFMAPHKSVSGVQSVGLSG